MTSAPISTPPRTPSSTEGQQLDHELKLADAAAVIKDALLPILDSLPVGICLVREDFSYIDVNRAWADMLGYRKDEVTALTFIDITHPEDQDVDAALSQRLFSGDIPYFRVRKRWLRKDGTFFKGTLTATAFGPVGSRIGLGSIVVDHDADEESSQNLELSVFAHDLRNLLMVVSGSADSLKSEFGERRSLDAIDNAAGLALSLTQNLIRASSANAKGADIAESIIRCVELQRATLPPRVVINCNLAPDLGRASLDDTNLCQILINLILNAVQAVGDSGEITLSAELRGVFCVISVVDDGIGMTDEQCARATEPFFTTKGAQGSGLGLALVDSTLREVGGWLELSSTQNVGTRATLQIPVS
ncbi:MAG: ATP-binding protein [Pseudomonadota bacterium]